MALTYDELSSVSKNYFDPKIYSQVYDSSPFFSRMKSKNKITYDGGKEIQFPIRYRKLDRAQEIGPREQIVFGGKDTRTAGIVPWAYYEADTTLEWDERVKNAGKGKIIDLAKDKAKELAEDLFEKLSYNFLTATSAGTNNLVPLNVLVDSTTTYAGVAYTDAASWLSTEDSTTTSMVMYGDGSLSESFNAATLGKNHPTVYYTTRDLLSKLESLLQPQIRYTNENTLNKKFYNVMFQGGEAYGDSFLPTSAFFGVDENALELVCKTGEDEVTDWFSLEQAGRPKTLAKVAFWVGNVKFNRRNTSFKYTALDHTK